MEERIVDQDEKKSSYSLIFGQLFLFTCASATVIAISVGLYQSIIGLELVVFDWVVPTFLATRVEWTSLNNKYLTTQPYAVSYDPQANSNDVMAGFQDNSTWFTDSESIEKPWVDQLGGDGSFNAIADGGRTRYVSAQGGVVFRLNINEAGEEESFTRVQPAGASGFSFIASKAKSPVPVATSKICFGWLSANVLMAFLRHFLSIPTDKK